MAAGGEEDIWNERFPLGEEAEMLGEEEDEWDRILQLCIDEGMVEKDEWKDKLKEIYPHWSESDLDPLGVVEEVAKATCLVVRNRGSQERYEYHVKKARDTSLSAKDREDHQAQAERCFKKPGCGTGLLMRADLRFALIITANHLIMNDDEAKNAEVYFDYVEDGEWDEKKKFKLASLVLVTRMSRTDHEEDYTNLDCSMLVVKVRNEEEDQFLRDHALSGSLNEALDETSLENLPILMISHPHSLGQRLSYGRGLAVVNRGLSHVKHTLGSCKGSSGGFVFAIEEDDGRLYITSVCTHYRHQRGVLWGRIQTEDTFTTAWRSFRLAKWLRFVRHKSDRVQQHSKRMGDLLTSAALCRLMICILIMKDSPGSNMSDSTVRALKYVEVLEDCCTSADLCQLMKDILTPPDSPSSNMSASTVLTLRDRFSSAMKHIWTPNASPSPDVSAAMLELERLEGIWTDAALRQPLERILRAKDSLSPTESAALIRRLDHQKIRCVKAFMYELCRLVSSLIAQDLSQGRMEIQEVLNHISAFYITERFLGFGDTYIALRADREVDEVIKSEMEPEDIARRIEIILREQFGKFLDTDDILFRILSDPDPYKVLIRVFFPLLVSLCRRELSTRLNRQLNNVVHLLDDAVTHPWTLRMNSFTLPMSLKIHHCSKQTQDPRASFVIS